MSKNDLWTAVPSPFLVPDDGSFRIAKAPTDSPADSEKSQQEKALKKHVREIRDHQRKLYASDDYSVLFVFQAMDAAGKDGTIRAVFTGVNPAGFQVSAFKAPSGEELDHDFLWRIATRLPQRGRIGVFNRSHYEEVITVRVHPEFLDRQKLPRVDLGSIWAERYESIRGFEEHLARNGTVVVKFFLNVSLAQQKRRLLRRIDEPRANWKFNPSDVDERERWLEYMDAFEDALNETSRPWAPWYVIPADNKPYMRTQVANIVEDTLASLGVDFPTIDEETRAALADYRKVLESQ